MLFPIFRKRPAGLFLLVGLAASWSAGAELPDPAPDAFRVQQAVGKFSDTTELAIEYRLRSPRWLRAHRLELAVGALSDGVVTRPFLSLGPVWRKDIATKAYVDFGFSPTLLSDATVDDRSLGGHLHFTSSLSIGTRFGAFDQYSVALRAQHVSNGGLDSRNPGIDVVGLRFDWTPSD